MGVDGNPLAEAAHIVVLVAALAVVLGLNHLTGSRRKRRRRTR